jgi:hypothetical protein
VSDLRSSGPAGIALSFRLARRLALETPGRSLLIVFLIAIPILGLSGVDTVEASHDATPAESVHMQLGNNQAMLNIVSPPDKTLVQDPLAPRVFTQSTTDGGQPTVSAHGLKPLAPREILPIGTSIIPVRTVNVVAKTRTGLASFYAIAGEVWRPVFSGHYDLQSGVRPESNSEILVTPAGLERLGISIGGTVTLTKPRFETFTVVGTITDPYLGSNQVELFGRDGVFDGVTADQDLVDSDFYLPSTPLNWTQVRQLNAQGATVLSRDVILNPPPVDPNGNFVDQHPANTIGILFISLLGAFALFEVCLLAGAAFVVGAKRQQRMLAILSSVGAERRVLFRVMSFGGVLLGLVGGILGTALGLVAAWIAMPLLDGGESSQYPGFHVDVPVLLLIVATSVVSGWIAAAIPARSASRVDVIAALRGARRPPRPTRRAPIAGLVVVALGVALSLVGGALVVTGHQGTTINQNLTTWGTVLLVAGPILTLLGVLLVVPLLLRGMMRLFAHLGPGARLAARDAARNPSRTVPAIAVIMSTVFVSALIMCLLGGGDVLTARDYRWQAPLHLAQVSLYTESQDGRYSLAGPAGDVASAMNSAYGIRTARVLSSTPDVNELGTTVPEYVVPRVAEQANGNFLFSYGGGDHVSVGSIADLETILGEPLTARSRQTLEAGGVVSLWPDYMRNGQVTLDWYKSGSQSFQPSGQPIRTIRLPAVLQRSAHEVDFGMFMLASTADSNGIPYRATDVVAALSTLPTDAQQDALRGAVSVVGATLNPQIETGPGKFASGWSWAVLALATLIALTSAVIALSLARAEGRADDGVLDSLGAAPRVQRSFQFWQAIIITATASIFGVALALVPAIALGTPADGETHGFVPFAPPVAQLLATAVGIPAVIAIGAWVIGRRRRVRWNVRVPIG